MNKTSARSQASRFTGLIFLILFLTALTAPGRATSLTLAYSNDVRGETEPCG